MVLIRVSSAECGFFLDYPLYDTQIASVVALHHVFSSPEHNLNLGCVVAYRDAPWKCFFAPVTTPFIQTRFFAVNSVYDAWQGVNVVGLPLACVLDPAQCTPTQQAAFDGFRLALLANLTAATPQSYFLYNCATHCGQFAHDQRYSLPFTSLGRLMALSLSLSLSFSLVQTRM